MKLLALALSLLSVVKALDVVDEVKVEEEVEAPTSSPNLNVEAIATFPQSEIFGIKLVNGRATDAVINFSNNEPTPITVIFIGGALHSTTGPDVIVRNLTMQRYGLEIPAGEKQSVTYSFATELHPADLRLSLSGVVTNTEGAFYTLPLHNGTVSVVEAPTSIFDPQIIFLYLILAAVFSGTVFFIYNTWITTLFPQQRGRGKGGERAKASTRGKKAVDPADQVSVVGADGPAVTSGAQAQTFDQSWIPEQHLKRPEAKRIGSSRTGTPKTKKAI